MACGVAAQDPAQIEQEESAPPGTGSRITDLIESINFQQPQITPASVLQPTTKERAPSSVTVISDDIIRRSGARYPSDILRLGPGIEVQRLSSTESNVSMRGFNDSSTASQGVLGLLDGRQVYNEFLGTVLWDQLPIGVDDIDQIDVIRGPGSYVHGPNAMHGVVVFHTKSPLEYGGDLVDISAGYGTYNSVLGRLIHVHKIGSTAALKTTLAYDDIDQFELSSFKPDHDTRDKGVFQTRFESLIGDDEEHRIDLTVGASQQKFDTLIPTVAALPPANYTSDATELNASAVYEYHGLRALVSWSGWSTDSVPSRLYAPLSVDLDTIDTDLQYSHELGEHRLTGGTGYRHSTFTTFDLDVSQGRHSTDIVWAFAQGEFKIGEQLDLTAGIRWDHHSTAGSNFSPRVAAVWEFMARQYLRASYGTGFRNPSLRELWFDMPVGGVARIGGNEDLKAESLRSAEVSYTGSFFELEVMDNSGEKARDGRRGRLNVGVNGYYNVVSNLIEYQPAGAGVVAPRNLTTDQETFGFEIEGEYLFTNYLAGFGNYSYGVRRDRDTRERNPLAPAHKANVGLRASSGGWEGMLWANYVDDTELFNTVIPEYWLLNASLSYRFPLGTQSGSVFVRGFNILDNVHREHPEGDAYGILFTGGVSVRF